MPSLFFKLLLLLVIINTATMSSPKTLAFVSIINDFLIQSLPPASRKKKLDKKPQTNKNKLLPKTHPYSSRHLSFQSQNRHPLITSLVCVTDSFRILLLFFILFFSPSQTHFSERKKSHRLMLFPIIITHVQCRSRSWLKVT